MRKRSAITLFILSGVIVVVFFSILPSFLPSKFPRTYDAFGQSLRDIGWAEELFRQDHRRPARSLDELEGVAIPGRDGKRLFHRSELYGQTKGTDYVLFAAFLPLLSTASEAELPLIAIGYVSMPDGKIQVLYANDRMREMSRGDLDREIERIRNQFANELGHNGSTEPASQPSEPNRRPGLRKSTGT